MKKIVFLAAMMAVWMGLSAQWLDFPSNNGRCDLGFHAGIVGQNCNYSGLGFGASFNVYGVNIDFVYSLPEHQFDNSSAAGQYNDTSVLSINLGYQIPILPWLRIMPVIGHCHTKAGVTDVVAKNEDESKLSATMYHDFDVKSSKHYLNYGGGVVVQPFDWLNLYAVYTIHSIYGGISFSFGERDYYNF